MLEYDQIADWYVAARKKDVGIKEVTEFARLLPPQSSVLDLGCGDGIPISKIVIDSGFELYAIDSSAKLIAKFRANFPGIPARCEIIEDSHFFGRRFNAVIAWGVFFHMTDKDQANAISKIARALELGGKFLFTAGKTYGTRTKEMSGVQFSYLSLGSDTYKNLLHDNDMKLLREFMDESDNYYYLAERSA